MTSAILHSPVLFAAGFDWLEAVLPILFVLFWILSQVFAVFRRLAGGPAKPPVVRVPAAPRPAARPEVHPRAELDRQIEEFLRQATGESAGVVEPARTPKRPRTEAARPRGGSVARPEPATSSGTTAPPMAPPQPAPAQRLTPGAERQLGTLETQPSDVARHVRDAFAQKLGHLHSGLESRGGDSAEEAAMLPVATGRLSPRGLVAAARDPATIRQAILLREILDRPVDRW